MASDSTTSEGDGAMRMMKVAIGCGLLTYLVAALAPFSTTAAGQAPGTLDAGFGDDGWRVVDVDGFDDQAWGVDVLSDGRILVGGEATTESTGSGDFVVLALTASGERDPAFSADGLATFDFDAASGQGGRRLFADARGRLVLPGWHVNSLGAARVLPDGDVDLGFDGDGLAALPDTTTQTGHGGAIDTGGRVAIVGQSDNSLAVALFDQEGAPVPGFGGGGLAVIDFEGFDQAAGLDAMFQDDRLLVCGFVVGPSDNAMVVARLTPQGALDSSFGGGKGYTVGRFGSLHEAHAMALLPDGRLLLTGVALSRRTPGYVVARHLADGALDTSFGANGYVFSPGLTEAHDLVLLPDGSFYVAGAFERLGRTSMAVGRHRADGTLDTGFAGTGVAIFQSGRDHGVARAAALHGNDGLLLVGDIQQPGSHSDLAVIRVRR
jgi:uncharacterized delta-60 repeat protein